MHFTVAGTFLVATLLLAGRGALANSLTVINECPFEIFLWSVGDVQGHRSTLPPGGVWNEPYYRKKDGSGPSIKLSKNPHSEGRIKDDIYQVEYTPSDDGRIHYDMSAVDCFRHDPWGCPFVQEGTKLEIDNPACNGFECLPGDVYCHQSYHRPFDDFANRACPSGGALTFTACSAEPTYEVPAYTPEPPVESAPAPSPEPVPEHVPDYAPEATPEYIVEDIPEQAKEEVPDYALDQPPVSAPEPVPDPTPDYVPDPAPEEVTLEYTVEDVAEEPPVEVLEVTLEYTAEYVADGTQDSNPDWSQSWTVDWSRDSEVEWTEVEWPEDEWQSDCEDCLPCCDE